MTELTSLVLVTVVSSALYLVSLSQRWQAIAFVSKPLATSALIVFVLLSSDLSAPIVLWVLAALIFATLGDVLLIFEEFELVTQQSSAFVKHSFTFGLASFLFAHLLYLAAISVTDMSLFLIPVNALPILFSVVLVGYLWRNLDAMRIPVTIYAVVICVLMLAAVANYVAQPNPDSMLLLIGVLMFALSDSMIAIKQFAHKFPYAQTAIIATYYLAQWSIVLGLLQ